MSKSSIILPDLNYNNYDPFPTINIKKVVKTRNQSTNKFQTSRNSRFE